MADSGSEGEFWRRIERSGTPLIEDTSDGQVRVTFLFRENLQHREGLRRDESASPFRVYVDASSLTDHHGLHLTTMTRLDDTGIWFWSTETSRSWRGSYRFMPVSKSVADELDPPGIGQTIDGVRSRFLGLLEHARQDEFNAKGFGRASMAEMPDAPVQRWWNDLDLPRVEPRKLQWDSALLGVGRDVWIHESPAAKENLERPLVVILDGNRWVDESPLAPVLDRATEAGQLPPAVFLFVDSIDSETRGRELPCNRKFWEAVIEELLPLAATEASFSDDPRRTVVSGQSYGGLASLYAGLEFPERFGLVSSQSGSFWWPVMSHGDQRGAAGGYIAEFLENRRYERDTPIAVDMNVGIHEGDMVRHNAHIRDMLRERNFEVTYEEFDGGHEWLCWRSTLVESLVRLLDEDSSEEVEHPTDQPSHDDENNESDQSQEHHR